MRNRITIRLGAHDYSVPHLNLGEIEEVHEALADETLSPLKRSYALLAIAFKRAEPELGDVRAVEASPIEVRAAIDSVLKHSGLQATEGADPNASAPAAAGAG